VKYLFKFIKKIENSLSVIQQIYKKYALKYRKVLKKELIISKIKSTCIIALNNKLEINIKKIHLKESLLYKILYFKST